MGGSGPTARGTFDINRRIDETTAIRLNGMVHRQDVQDRDRVKSDRAGFAASLGFGLGTDTTWHLNYLYQHSERTPDYGVPTVRRPATATPGRSPSSASTARPPTCAPPTATSPTSTC